jgi:hypothetical protein
VPVPVEMTHFVQDSYLQTDEFGRVADTARRLLDHLNTVPVQELIRLANVPRIPSSRIQAAFLGFAKELGFKDESRGLFAAYDSAVRPDYFLELGDTGVILEVERGKTVRNNMDFLDFWKCHICDKAHYLFLLVPRSLQHNPETRPVNEYVQVCRRLRTFFTSRNYTNVRGLFIFGY